MESKNRTLVADRAAGLSTVPAEALLLESGPFTFAAGEAQEGKIPVKMRARGGQPIYHWYWGNVAHDMAGFSPAEATIPIDYCHYFDEVLGFLNKFEPSNEGLDVAGELVSFAAEDRTAEVTHKARAGVPYQASIFFEPKVLEEVLPGAEAEVNGYRLPGPGLVIRKWSLRGVAVCPYGYDPRTSTRLAFTPGGEVPVQFVSPAPENAMSVKAKSDKKEAADRTDDADQKELSAPSAKSVVPAPAEALDPRAEFAATLKKFSEKFGAENGAQWAAEGLSYEAALEKHAEALGTKLAAEKTKSTDLTTKLAAIPRGEATPVTFSDGDGKGAEGQDVGQLKQHLGDNLARFAAGLKMPGKK